MGLCFLLLINSTALGHEGSHAPATQEVGKYGGILADVVIKDKTKDYHHSKKIYKAEIVRSSESQTIRIYVYDQKKKLLDLTNFKNYAMVDIKYKNKSQYITRPTYLRLHKNYFMGKSPKPKRKPFNLEITLNENDQDLLVIFEDLD